MGRLSECIADCVSRLACVGKEKGCWCLLLQVQKDIRNGVNDTVASRDIEFEKGHRASIAGTLLSRRDLDHLVTQRPRLLAVAHLDQVLSHLAGQIDLANFLVLNGMEPEILGGQLDDALRVHRAGDARATKGVVDGGKDRPGGILIVQNAFGIFGSPHKGAHGFEFVLVTKYFRWWNITDFVGQERISAEMI